MKALFPTDDGWPGLVLRLTLGLVMFPHGAQELLGHGCEGTMRAFTQKMGMPWVIRFLVMFGEFFRHLALLAGLLTRFTAASLAVIMLGASTMVHQPQGFFMNWFGKQQGEGDEFMC
jgi:putative oxidoreductase